MDKDIASQHILERLCEGKSLRAICSANRGELPSAGRFCGWLAEDKNLAEQYTRARETQADLLADEIIHISDTDPDPQRARIRTDVRKWYAGKVRPKVYGDKVQTEQRNVDKDGNDIQQVIVIGAKNE